MKDILREGKLIFITTLILAIVSIILKVILSYDFFIYIAAISIFIFFIPYFPKKTSKKY